MPQVVVFPRSAEEVQAAVSTAVARGVAVTARVGGTSVAGNAVGPGIVLDLSRYLNRVLQVDHEGRTAVVQPGVVQARLQAEVAPLLTT